MSMQFLDFEILKQIGVGNHGIVYKAIDKDQRIVALKLIKVRSMTEWLKNRCHFLASLMHTNLVKVFDYGVLDDTVWISQQLIDGQKFFVYNADQGRLLPTLSKIEKLNCVRQIVNVLSYLYQDGLIHKDCPGHFGRNVLLQSDKSCMVIDVDDIKDVPLSTSKNIVSNNIRHTGIFLFEMLKEDTCKVFALRYIRHTAMSEHTIQSVMKIFGTFSSNLYEDELYILAKCFLTGFNDEGYIGFDVLSKDIEDLSERYVGEYYESK